MNKKEDINIYIIDKRGIRPLFRNILSVLILCTPIYIGVLTGSTAMQWIGFVVGILLFLSLVVEFNKIHRYKSVDEAIRALEAMRDDVV